MTVPRTRLRRPPAVQHARLAAAAPAASRAAEVADAPWYRLGPTMEVVGAQDDEDATATRADVYVYDYIGGWRGSTAENFGRDVAGLDVDELHIHLNSPGGDCFEGVTIAAVLRAHRARVTVWVDGLAASAASVIAMAGDEVVMGIGAQLMIHDASMLAWGNAAELQKAAAAADSISQGTANAYAAKAGGTAEQWRAVMVAETWYDGPSAVAAGLADREATAADAGTATGIQVVPGSPDAGSLGDWWAVAGSPAQHASTVRELYQHGVEFDTRVGTHPPVELHAPQTPAASAGGSHPTQERSRAVAFSDDQLTTMRQELGLAADADEATIMAAFTEALDERAEPAPTHSATTMQLPAGVVAIDQAALDQLTAKAERGVRADEAMQRQHRDTVLQTAVREGRIPPARRPHYEELWQLDPVGTEEQITQLAKGVIPVTAEVGHDHEGAAEVVQTLDTVRQDPAYKSWSI